MTLAQVIDIFEKVAMQQPSINMIVQNDVFRINSSPSLKYGIFAWTQGQHSGSIAGMTSYAFSFFYVDRLKDDLSNQVEVQSAGCETIGNILRALEEYDIEVGNYTMQTFNQRFTDECAGVFCNVTLSVPQVSACPETYGERTDFLIY